MARETPSASAPGTRVTSQQDVDLHKDESEVQQQECQEEQGQEPPEEEKPVEELLPNTTIVTHCIYKNDPHRFLRCFEDETDPFKDDVVELLNVRDEDGKSPLDIAACLGRVELTRELLKRGAEINAYTLKGYSCMHYAAAWGRLPVLKILIENGGDFEKKNTHGERPRETAQRYLQTNCVDYLDWAEARHKLREEIRKTLETFQEVDKAAAGRLSKDEKALAIGACKEKQEWLDNTPEPTTEDFIAHYTSLKEIVTPIIQKLCEPPPPRDSSPQKGKKKGK